MHCHLCFSFRQYAWSSYKHCKTWPFAFFKFKVWVDKSKSKCVMFFYVVLSFSPFSFNPFFFLSCIAANTGDQHKRSSVPMNHDFKAVIICYFCQHLLWRLKVTFPPRVNVIVLNICCLWAILELFKRRTATSGQKDCLGFTVRKWLISKTSCLFVCMRHVAGL